MITRSTLFYGAVSGACLLLHNVFMIAGDAVGWSLAFSMVLSFCVVGSTGYVLHTLLTFRAKLRLSSFGRYLLAMSANTPLAFVMVWALHEVFSLKMIWASPVSTLCMVGVNNLLSRWAIMSKANEINR